MLQQFSTFPIRQACSANCSVSSGSDSTIISSPSQTQQTAALQSCKPFSSTEYFISALLYKWVDNFLSNIDVFSTLSLWARIDFGIFCKENDMWYFRNSNNYWYLALFFLRHFPTKMPQTAMPINILIILWITHYIHWLWCIFL